MKDYFFNNYLDYEDGKDDLEKLVNFLNENPGSRVYFGSNGGICWVMEIVLEIINEKCGELVAVADIQSAGFKLFFLAKCKKRLAPSTTGMFHLAGRKMRITSEGRPDNEDDEFWFKETRKRTKEDIKFCESIGMNENEVKKIKASRNVLFTQKRLNELLKFQLKNETIQSLPPQNRKEDH